MDRDSTAVFAFLACLQDRMEQLRALWLEYVKAGVKPSPPHMNVSGRLLAVYEGDRGTPYPYDGSLTLGLLIQGKDGREYNLSVKLRWSSERGWLIETDTWVADENGKWHLVRQLPQRRPDDLEGCIRELREAVADLNTFRDIVCAEP